jgi:fructose-1,6-bisphosphatase/inositol monophosphatase family enzyme
MLSVDDLQYLADAACTAARAAGKLIAGSRPEQVEEKVEGTSKASRVVTEVDGKSQEVILGVLRESVARYSLGVLCEEGEDDRGRLTSDYFWSVDPLDGTLPYIESRPGYAVSIALVSQAGLPEIGVIFDPCEDLLYCAIRGKGITCNGVAWVPPSQSSPARLSVLADRSFAKRPDYPQLVAALDELSMGLGGDRAEVLLGRGAVMNACYVLSHSPACYFKFPKSEAGGGALWDFAATACLFGEAGAVASDIFGHPLELNRSESTWMNHRGVLYATSSSLAKEIMAIHAAETTMPWPTQPRLK